MTYVYGARILANKTVLIISYHFAPRAIASAIRPTSVAKHISAFGWTPVVLTVKNPDRFASTVDESIKVPADLNVETAYSINIPPILVYIFVRIVGRLLMFFTKRRLPDSFASDVVFPDHNVGWVPFCLLKAMSLIKKYKIDLVYITCKPFSSALVGYFLKKRFKDTKIVVEFQDPWSITPYHNHSNFYRKLAKSTEKAIFKNIDLFLVVTKGHDVAYKNEYEWLHVKHV